MSTAGFQHSDERIQSQKLRLAQEEHACRCVARIFVNGREEGSGFLLPNNWLLTCHHVLPDDTAAGHRLSFAEFDYFLRTDGTSPEPVRFHFSPETFPYSPFNGGNDWALLKLKPNPTKGLASVLYGGLPLQSLAPERGDPVTVIQHPAGEMKKTASSKLTDVTTNRLYHDVATEGGSSGSPVFDAEWRVIAMHRGAHSETKKEAVHINAILEDLQHAGVLPLEPVGREPMDERGTMAPDSPWYVERQADKVAFAHFFKNHGITLALNGPPQLGKSSMAARLEAALVKQNWQSVTIDLSLHFTAERSPGSHEFFRAVAQQILREAGGHEAALANFERDGNSSAFKAFLQDLGRDATKPLLLILDRLDALAGKPACSPVLTGLRVAHNAQGLMNKRAWLKFILITTSKPRQTGPDGSIFDVAKDPEIEDFTLPELHELVLRHAPLQVDATRLHEFLGGHPCFTRQALNELAAGGTLDDLIAEALRDGGIFHRHLKQVVKDFRDLPDGKALSHAFRGMLEGKLLDSEETFEALASLGVVRGADAAHAAPRCQLYRDWLPSHLPK